MTLKTLIRFMDIIECIPREIGDTFEVSNKRGHVLLSDPRGLVEQVKDDQEVSG